MPDDGTDRLEGLIDRASQRHAELLNRALDRLAPRPLFSQKVSAAERRKEYELMREYPQVLAQFFADQNATVESAIDYVWESEHESRGQR